jgi:hypothetical protein
MMITGESRLNTDPNVIVVKCTGVEGWGIMHGSHLELVLYNFGRK